LPVTTRRIYDARAGFKRPFRRPIGAAVINDNHFGRHAGREAFANHTCDWFFLIERGDDNRHLAHRKTSHALVK
jgi:hypothetical protein